jgi:Putative peptidoglycan binding domain
MEGRRERDPGYDDWFDEPEPPTETQSAVGRGVYEDADEVWVLPEDDEPRSPAHREFVVAGRTLTTTQLAIIGICILAVFFAILAAAGVFNGSSPPAQSLTPTTKPLTNTTPTTAAANTTPTVQGPSQPLNPGDTGSQVKLLQQSLNTLGFSVGKPDGVYGPATQNAVERFQVSQGLPEDGIVGPQTLNAIQKQLSKQ